MDIEKIINEAGAAVRTLKTLGYTYHGAEYWKPPLGDVKTIELIHGEAYQFTNIEDNTIKGIYSEDEHSFMGTCVEWAASTCTNIQPLTVEVK